jgi:ATP-dependent exoDNAse (exonuclease V) beta subunit
MSSSKEQPFVDANARQAIHSDLQSTLWVEASAGTGKTTALVSRIVALVSTGTTTLGQIVAVTFTEKAAGEMKLRLRSQLEEARGASTGQPLERLEYALQELEVARIGTIHSLAADLLHERPLEAHVDPMFGVNATGIGGHVFRTAFESWFQSVLNSPPEGIRRILRRARGPKAGQSPRDMLRRAAWTLISNRDFDSPWTRPQWNRNAAIEELLPQAESLAQRTWDAYDREDYLAKNLEEVRRFIDELQATEAALEDVNTRDYDAIESRLYGLSRSNTWRWRGRGRMYGEGLTRAEVIEERDEFRQHLDAFVLAAGADLAACLREDLRPVVQAYDSLKERSGELDFLDLLLKTRDLLRNEASVRAQIQERFTHIFVDEFQDTDPLQAEILLLMSAEDSRESDWRLITPKVGKLFVVGDPKQSIYRFRRADVSLYERLKMRFISAGAKVLTLSTSFRSVPNLQNAVNAAFKQYMQGGDSQADYVDLSPHRDDISQQPSLIALPVPEPYASYGKITSQEVAKSLPLAVGGWVRWLVEDSGWQVEEEGRNVPVAPHHICLLFRRFQSYGQDTTQPYLQALENHGVPHILVGGHSFHKRDEVRAIRNALTALEWPNDEVAVVATLTGPLFAVQNDALLLWKHTIGRLDPTLDYDSGLVEGNEILQEVAGSMAVLLRLHRTRNRRPVADTLEDLLESTRAHAGFAISRTGRQTLANVLRTVDLARAFDAASATSFRGFAERLQEEFQRGETGDAPIVEEGSEGVRVMTVHKAKGLEFPVVILCDPQARLASKTPSFHIDAEAGVWLSTLAGCTPHDLLQCETTAVRRDEEEGVRLAYVAATRARDVLVVPALGDEELNGWFSPLISSVYPEWSESRQSQPVPGCPQFGEETVLRRPARAKTLPLGSIRPGLHIPRIGHHSVAWWDPKRILQGDHSKPGIQQQLALQEGEGAAESQERWKLFVQSAAVRQVRASAPSLISTSVSQQILEDSPALAAHPVEWLETKPRGKTRPRGKRFGVLVHETLASYIADSLSRDVPLLVAGKGRQLGATPQEQAAAVHVVQTCLEHPLIKEALTANTVFQEHPFHLIRNGHVLEGVIDLCFIDKTDNWIIVDFKTDLEVNNESKQRYEAQVALYCMAIQEMTSKTARGVLLLV